MTHVTAFSLRHPKTVLLLAAAVSAIATGGAFRLRSETGYRATLGDSNPSVRRLDAFISNFGGGLPIQVAWECSPAEPCRSALDPWFLRAAQRIAKKVEAAPGVTHVYTPGNTPVLVAHAGEIQARRLLEQGRPAADFDALVAAARRDPLWRGNLVSRDGRTAALVVELESSDPTQYNRAVHVLLKAVHAEAPRHYALVGDPIDFVLGGGELIREGRLLGMVALILVAGTIWVLFRKASVILPALATVGLAALWTLGLMGWLGWPQNEVSQALVPLLLVVGICDAIHLLSQYRDLPRGSPELAQVPRAERIERAARDVGWPCVLTSVTTAAGVGSFVTSDLVAFVHFGVAAAAGVMFALAVTFTVMPVLVSMLRIEIPERAESAGWVRSLEVTSRATERHALGIVIASVSLLAVAGWGVSQLRVDVSKESLYGSASPIVKWQRWMAEHIRRPDTLEVQLSSPKGSSIDEPSGIATIERVSSFLQAQPHLGPVRSIVDPLKRMNELIHDGDPAMDRPGITREQNEQLLLTLLSTDRNAVASWITPDRREARLSVEADLLSARARHRLLASVRSHLDRQLPAGWSYELTGPLPVFETLISATEHTQLRSFASAGMLVPLLVVIGLGSVMAGAWVSVAAALPIALTLGAMGILGRALDTGTAMIAAILLGIAVDDGIHLVSRYKRHRRSGRDRSDAMHGSIQEVGRPVVATSVILAAGFLTMLLSSWGTIAAFGFLSACTILLALVSDLFFLPAIVFLGSRRRPQRGEGTMDASPLKPHARVRAAGMLMSGLVIALLLGQSATEVLGSKATARPECEPLENGIVALSAALVPGCPLRAFELTRPAVGRQSFRGVRASFAPVRFAVERHGFERWVSVPRVPDSSEGRVEAILLVSVVSFLFLGVCFIVLWGSPAPAAVPLVVGATSAVAVANGVTLGPWSTTASLAGTAGLAILPAALAHLALTFPMERPVLRATSRFLFVIYVPAGVVSFVSLWSYFYVPELFALVSQTFLLMTAIGVVAVLVSSISVLRRSPFALYRARARILLWTLAGAIAAGSVLLWAPPAVMTRIPGGRPGALGLVMLATLLPLVRTVRRYHGFDIPARAVTALHLSAQGASFVAFALLANMLLPESWEGIEHTLATAGLAWFGVAVLELVLWGPLRFQETRRSEERSTLGLVHASRLHALSARGQLAEALRRTVDVAVRPRFVTVFLLGSSGWFPAAASRSGPTDEALAVLASEVAFAERAAYLADESAGRAEGAEMLRQAGVETVVPLGEPSSRRGIAILGHAPEPLGRRDLEFLDTLAAQTTTGLAWLETAEDLAHTRALAQGGFLAASLTHDLGKPLSNIWAVARSALKPERTPAEIRQRLAEIQEFSDQGLDVIDRLFARMKARTASRHTKPLGEIITLSCQAAEQRHRRRVIPFFPAEMPDVEGEFEITQALSALLDNACRESLHGTSVEISVKNRAGGVTQIEVADGGAGMDEETKARAFEPWFTRRAAQGGRGLGLALSQLLIRQLGGEIEIAESEPGKGTRMRIVLPDSIRKAPAADATPSSAPTLPGNAAVPVGQN